MQDTKEDLLGDQRTEKAVPNGRPMPTGIVIRAWIATSTSFELDKVRRWLAWRCVIDVFDVKALSDGHCIHSDIGHLIPTCSGTCGKSAQLERTRRADSVPLRLNGRTCCGLTSSTVLAVCMLPLPGPREAGPSLRDGPNAMTLPERAATIETLTAR